MKTLDIRFVKERDSKRLAEQVKMVERLEKILPERIDEKFHDVHVRVRFSSSGGFDIYGFNADERKKFVAFLEELWDDPFLLEE